MHYLTKWELYMALARGISLSPVVYCFKVYKHLPALQKLPFFHTEPDFSVKQLREICDLREANNRVFDCSPISQFGIYLSRNELREWLKGYLLDYQKDNLFDTKKQLFCSHESSMRYTLDLLKQYTKINSKRVLFKETLDNLTEKPIKIDDKVRLFEDIMVLKLKRYIDIAIVDMLNRQICYDVSHKDDYPIISLYIWFRKSINEIESLLRETPEYANLPAEEKPKIENIDTQKILEELKAAVIQTKSPNYEEEDNPNSYLGLRIENRKIYYKDNPIPMQFREDSKEIKLIKHLIKQKGKPSHRDDLIDIVGLTSKKNKERNIDVWGNEEKRGPKKDVRKRNLDKLRHIINVVSNKLSDVNLTIVKIEKRCITLKKLDK